MDLKFYLNVYGLSLLLFLHDAAFGKPALQKRKNVEISDKKLNRLIKLALEGFRTAIAVGDEHLKLESFDPYLIEDNLLWYYDDGIGQTRIFSSSRGISFLYGLSSYAVEDVSANMRDLDAVIKLKFNRLQFMGKYKFGGHLFGGIIPLCGEGAFGATALDVDGILRLNMSLIDGFISVDTTSVQINLDNFSVKAEKFMSVPTSYSNAILNEILRRLYEKRKERINRSTNEILEEWLRNTFEGMNVQSMMELLEYLSKKASR